MRSGAYDPGPALRDLRDFQLRTVDFVVRRYFDDPRPTRRFLVADPVGMGKTFVARGVIARVIERLERDDSIPRIDVVYVCSNSDIATQNVRRLEVPGEVTRSFSRRLTLLATQAHDLDRPPENSRKTINLVAFTPGTSFDLAGQGGIAAERALLHHLLVEHYGLGRAEKMASKRIFQGGVTNLDRFSRALDDMGWKMDEALDEEIVSKFLRKVGHDRVGRDYRLLVEAVQGRKPSPDERARARQLVGRLRDLLARASIDALQPDLVILDEFQRFKHLLDPRRGGEAAELAHHLFEHQDARVLLLSATPYKMYTLAEEASIGEDHYRDFLDTVRFLADGTAGAVDPEEVAEDLAALRQALIRGVTTEDAASRVSGRLRQVMCRTERPDLDGHGLVREQLEAASLVEADDFVGYARLRRLADTLDAAMTVEYWKSAPYFLNFVDGYQLGSRLREGLRDRATGPALRALASSAQRLDRDDVGSFKEIDLGNAKLRQLAAHTVSTGWWKYLWLPPSLPYYKPTGVWAEPGSVGGFTKRIVFSSWAATPTAVAALLSYEAERLASESKGVENTPQAREALRSRLDLRIADGRPAAMTALALFWPMPALARACDPLATARATPDRVPTLRNVRAMCERGARGLVGANGASRSSTADAWYWSGPISRDDELPSILRDVESSKIVEAFAGGGDTDDERADPAGPSAHVQLAIEAVRGGTRLGAKPADLTSTVGLLGMASPGNVAWRALGRLVDPRGEVTRFGHWYAAATLAGGFRTLFNRADSTLVLDGLSLNAVYWRAILAYCAQGGLQAVLDEYLHHLAEDQGFQRVGKDSELLTLAQKARSAIALRPAPYRAFDPLDSEGAGIAFPSRFALRYGTVRQSDEDARLPDIRAAFNSPFRPFVLATTSVGQEGVDFHSWCHAIVHWNSPPNPVDFEQREGRINRYKGHAVRRNVAAAHRADALRSNGQDPWAAAFSAAAALRPRGVTEVFPYWMYPGPHSIERHVPLLPFSRDELRYRQVRDTLTLYRMAFGQPRQEDFVALLQARGVQPADGQVLIDLRPR